MQDRLSKPIAGGSRCRSSSREPRPGATIDGGVRRMRGISNIQAAVPTPTTDRATLGQTQESK